MFPCKIGARAGRRAPASTRLAATPRQADAHLRRTRRLRPSGGRSCPSAFCCGATSGSQPSAEDAWEHLVTIKPQLDAAIAAQDFALAATLRDRSKELASVLPPIQQYLYHKVEVLQLGTADEKLDAIHAIGEVGDSNMVRDLACCLKTPALQDAAQDAMWSIFMRSRQPEVNELMGEGIRLFGMPDYEQALAVFDKIIAMEPTFAEGHNKRATVLYLMHRYEDSIDSCARVLQLQPYHFAALSGMGLCHLKLGQAQDALEAFTQAMHIHPGLRQLEKYVALIRQKYMDPN